MGNGYSCPSGFTTTGVLQCVPVCPADKGFENRVVGNEPRCVYTDDANHFITLKPASVYFNPAPDSPQQPLTWIQVNRPGLFAGYKASQDDLTAKLAAVLQAIDKTKQIADAFKALQAAEDTRDTAPQAYQDARVRYYSLVKGPEWATSERARILNADVMPTVASYAQTISDITARKAQQDKTKDVVGLVTSKLISMKNDFRTTTNTLTKQVDVLKNQVELEKRRAVVQKQETNDWVLNILLVILSLIVIVLLARKLWSRSAAPPAPAYTRGERRI
jgi:ribosomal silencing factor RsfS